MAWTRLGLRSQNGARQYFGVSGEQVRVDVRVAWEFASCYGVNLAFRWVWVWLFAGCEVLLLRAAQGLEARPVPSNSAGAGSPTTL